MIIVLNKGSNLRRPSLFMLLVNKSCAVLDIVMLLQLQNLTARNTSALPMHRGSCAVFFAPAQICIFSGQRKIRTVFLKQDRSFIILQKLISSNQIYLHPNERLENRGYTIE